MSKAKKGAGLAWIKEHVEHPPSDECLIWPFGMSKYGMSRDEDGRETTAHAIMCRLKHGPKPTPKHECAHSCGKGTAGCVHPHHLRWATRKENHADKKLHGTQQRGEAHGRCKLTEPQAIEIKALKGKMKQRDIARVYHISQPTVAAIHVGRIWSHLP